MSFSIETKLDIIRREEQKECCMLAELAAYIFSSGTVVAQGAGKFAIKLNFDIPALARRAYVHLRRLYGIRANISTSKHSYFGGGIKYILTLPSASVLSLATQLKLVDYNGKLKSLVPQYIPQKTCCKRAFLKAAFLSIGSVQNPQKGYHLELVSKSEYFIKILRRLYKSFNIDMKHFIRRESEIIYIKKADDISDFLALVDADSAVMKFENLLVRRQVINNINRAMNCDTSNINKTVTASKQQIDDIRLAMSMEQIDISLLEVANLRLSNPDLSLEQLAKLCNPPLSKSGVAYRLKKLHVIADKYR